MPALSQISQVGAVKGYRELLWKLKALKTQQRQFEDALSQINPTPIRPSTFSKALRENVIVVRCKNLLEKPRQLKTKLKTKVKTKITDFKETLTALSPAQADKQPATTNETGSTPTRPRHVIDPAKVHVHASTFEKILQVPLLAALGTSCNLWMHYLNNTTVQNQDIMEKAFFDRPAGQGLVTVSNHVASIDDPLIVAATLPLRAMIDTDRIRWTMCATDRCFHKEFLHSFFRAGKVLPVERGAGVRQWGMVQAEKRVSEGDWVHVFPEGTRRTDKKMGPVKRGVGHLVVEAYELNGSEGPVPLIVPFVHAGLEEIMPRGRSWPDTGYNAEVHVGDHINVDDLFEKYKSQDLTKSELQKAIADRIGGVLHSMHADLHKNFVQVQKADAEVPVAISSVVEQAQDLNKASDTQPTAEVNGETLATSSSTQRDSCTVGEDPIASIRSSMTSSSSSSSLSSPGTAEVPTISTIYEKNSTTPWIASTPPACNVDVADLIKGRYPEFDVDKLPSMLHVAGWRRQSQFAGGFAAAGAQRLAQL